MDNAVIIAIIGSSALTALITNIFQLIKERNAHVGGISSGVKLLLYDRIKYLAKSYIEQGFVWAEDLEDIQRMWDCYHDPEGLNGNGYLDNLMSNVHKLPIKS